ncbi:VW5B1 protein, partial [Notiomystis cincta]|nr:VW5B1 protein [Notiomystis cincta]
VQWEVPFDIRPLFRERESQEDGDTDLWSETFHHLAAKSLIQDFEQLAERECEIEHGSGRRFQLNAVHTSKACNVISKYTAFVPVDLSTNSCLPTLVQYTHTGATSKQGNQRKQKSSGNRRQRGCSPGRPQSACGHNGDHGFYSMNAEETSPSPSSTPPSSAWERCRVPEAGMVLEGRVAIRMSTEVMDIFSSFHRLTLNKTRLLVRAAKGFMSKSPSRGSEASSEGDNESMDYLPLVSLQLACGAFLLNSAFCKAVNIPMEKLKWTSPFACHRLSLSPSGSYSPRSGPSEHRILTSSQQLQVPGGQEKGPTSADLAGGALPEDPGRLRRLSGSAAERDLSLPAVTLRCLSSPAQCRPGSGQGWHTGGSQAQAALFEAELQQQTEPEGVLWATAVALAWLEHSSASYFIEWELVAAKASLWLSGQRFPEGSSLAAVKAAAQQLFVLLRHWDENLEFNLLCYNPGSV